MAVPRNESRTRPTRPSARGVLIVARDQQELYRNLQRAYRDTDELLVLRDRRQGERRRGIHPVADERRQRERRRLPATAHDLHVQPYVLVYPTDAEAPTSPLTSPRWRASVLRYFRDRWSRRRGTTPDR